MPTSLLRSRTDRQQLREARQQLRTLTQAVSHALAALDTVMQAPESPTRGKQIAAIANHLDMANDSALHCGLKQSFPTIAREKQRLRSRLTQKEPL